MNTAEELAAQAGAVNGAARDTLDHGLIYGSPNPYARSWNRCGILEWAA